MRLDGVSNTGVVGGHVSAFHIEDLDRAGGVGDGQQGHIAFLDNVAKAGIVGSLQDLLDGSAVALLFLVLGDSLVVDQTGMCHGHQFHQKLLVALDTGSHQIVGDQHVHAVQNGITEGHRGVSTAGNDLHISQSGVLTHISAGIIGTEVLGLGISIQLDAGDLALGVDTEGQLDGIAGVALGGGHLQGIAQTGGLLVDGLDGLGNLHQRGSNAAVSHIDGLEVVGLGHNGKQGAVSLRGVVGLDHGAGDEVQTEHRHGKDSKQGDQHHDCLTGLFVSHYFTPPRGSLAVHFSMKGVRMFMIRMEKDTPSG